jgi:hypothetical protein
MVRVDQFKKEEGPLTTERPQPKGEIVEYETAKLQMHKTLCLAT